MVRFQKEQTLNDLSIRSETCPKWAGVAAAALILAAFLNACTEAKPAAYPMRTVLPFGTVEMSVESTEASSDLNGKAILVHARMEKLDGPEQARVASQSWQMWFRIADRGGKTYKCRRILPASYYYRSFAEEGQPAGRPWGSSRAEEDWYSPVPTQWILRFDVPLDAQGFTLLINNMTFHTGGQPVSIAVPLDR